MRTALTRLTTHTSFLHACEHVEQAHPLAVHVLEGLANDLWLWKQECPDSSAQAFIFPNARKRGGVTQNSFIRTDNYRARVLKKLEAELNLPKLNFQGSAPYHGDARPVDGQRERPASHLGAQQRWHHGQRLHARDGVEREGDASGDLRRARGGAETGSGIMKESNLVRFGTVDVFGGRQVIDPQGLGA